MAQLIPGKGVVADDIPAPPEDPEFDPRAAIIAALDAVDDYPLLWSIYEVLMSGVIKRGKIVRADLANYDGRNTTYSRPDATGGTISGVPVGNDVDVLSVYGGGTARNDATIRAALQYIGAGVARLSFAPGTWTIDDNVTIPSTLPCHVAAGCVFNVASGKTLTFNTSVDVDYPASWKTGAGTVSATLSGDCCVSVKDFGAVGDGVTDDTAAIQNTVNSALVVLIPPLDYKVTSTITVPAGRIIFGYGAELICTSSQFNSLLLGSGCSVFGLSVTGPAAATYNANGIGIKCFGTNNAPSAPTFIDGPVIRDCTITNFGIYGIYLAYINGGAIEDNTITGIGYAGIGGASCNDLHIENNTVATIGPGIVSDAYGIFVDRFEVGTETSEPRSYRCTITNNKVSGVIATGGDNGQGIDSHAGVDFVIADNIVTGCEVGIVLTGSKVSGVQTLAPQRCVISGNVIDGLSVGYGIVVAGALTGSSPNEYASQIVVTDNVVLNHGAPNAATTGAVLLQATKSCVLSQNTIRNPATLGIHVNMENLGLSITGNTIIDPHDAVHTAPMCIRVNTNNVTGLISGNTFVFDNAALNTYVAVRSISITAGLTGLDLTIEHNALVGIDATHLLYIEGTATGVNASGFMTQRGSGTLAAGTLAVTFAKLFPSTPKVIIGLSDALNPVRAHTISATGFTAAGTSTDSFTWLATT